MATTSRIDLRIDPEKRRVIMRVAKLAGRNLSQYILDIAWPDAQQRVADETRLRLPARQWQRFCEQLDQPPRDLPELRRLLERPSRCKDA